MRLSTKSPLYHRLHKMAMTPKAQIKQLAIGSLLSIAAMFGLVLTSELEDQRVFYALSGLLIVAIAYAIPGYIGIWVWRMQAVLFQEKD